MLKRRFVAAWRAFKNPSLVDAPAFPLPGRPRTFRASSVTPGRFRVYHYDPVTNTDRMIYPEYKGQDSGAEARRILEDYVLTYAGEYVKLVDGDVERGRRTGGQ